MAEMGKTYIFSQCLLSFFFSLRKFSSDIMSYFHRQNVAYNFKCTALIYDFDMNQQTEDSQCSELHVIYTVY